MSNVSVTNACAKDNGGCEQYCMHLGNNKVRCTCMLSRVASDGRSCEGKFQSVRMQFFA